MNVEERVMVTEMQIRRRQLLTLYENTSGFTSQTFILLNKVQASACSTLLTTKAQSSSITNLDLGSLCSALRSSHNPFSPGRRMRTMEQGHNRVEDFPLNVFSVTPYTPSTADIQVSDDDKAGATLLFSGIFLGLVGITFTIMGWIKYQGVSHFEWTQLLGPILLSVGVTFILIAVCKFKMLSCQLCKESEERVPDLEQTAGGQSFVFTGINQPITFHGATVVQYIPPPYGSQEPLGMTTTYLQPVVSPCGLVPPGGLAAAMPSPPQYYTIYPPENAAFVHDQDYPSFVDAGDDRYGECSRDTPLPALAVFAVRKVAGECTSLCGSLSGQWHWFERGCGL